MNQYLANLARKFPMAKFLKSISTTCIPNWPDSNLPTIFIYHNGNMVKQFIGPVELRGMKLTEPGIHNRKLIEEFYLETLRLYEY